MNCSPRLPYQKQKLSNAYFMRVQGTLFSHFYILNSCLQIQKWVIKWVICIIAYSRYIVNNESPRSRSPGDNSLFHLHNKSVEPCLPDFLGVSLCIIFRPESAYLHAVQRPGLTV